MSVMGRGRALPFLPASSASGGAGWPFPETLRLCSVPSRVPTVTEEVAREALLSFVSSKCCYGSAAAGDLVIQELKQQTLCRVRGPGPGGPLGAASVMSNGCKESWGAVSMNSGDAEALVGL